MVLEVGAACVFTDLVGKRHHQHQRLQAEHGPNDRLRSCPNPVADVASCQGPKTLMSLGRNRRGSAGRESNATKVSPMWALGRPTHRPATKGW